MPRYLYADGWPARRGVLSDRTSQAGKTRGHSSRRPNGSIKRRGNQMRIKKGRRTVAGTSSLLALAIALPAAQAQAQESSSPDELDEIVVTGIIGSLQRNLDLKRRAPGVVDVITS